MLSLAPATKTETIGGVTTTYGYAYDTAGRLTDVSVGGVPSVHYTFDLNGNRLTKTTPAGVTTATYDAQDRQSSYGSRTYAWDINGTLKSVTDGIIGTFTSYQYDALGNLLSVTPSVGPKVEYVVDGANRRVAKKVGGVLRQAWLYQSALKPVAEIDPITGAVLYRYVYGSRGVVPDYVTHGTQTFRVISDHLGSPRLVVDVATGLVVQRTDYDEYGKVTTEVIGTGWSPLPFGFAGGMYDRDTGLVRFGARDYDPETGRWTAKDPAGIGVGSNLYVGGPGRPDFVGAGAASGRVFDVTTFRAAESHFARSYGDALELILYETPRVWP